MARLLMQFSIVSVRVNTLAGHLTFKRLRLAVCSRHQEGTKAALLEAPCLGEPPPHTGAVKEVLFSGISNPSTTHGI